MPLDTPVDAAPPLRPVRRERRTDEAQRQTMVTAVWPPARNDRIHALATLAVLTFLCTGGLLAFSAARRAAQAHRATRAAEAPASTAPVRRARIAPPTPTAPPTFSVSLSPPTAAAPAPLPTGSAGLPSTGPATDAAPRVDATGGLTVGTAPPLEETPIPGDLDEAPRVRARRLNTEGFRAYEAGDRATALAQYRKATQADPAFALPWYNLACIEALEGRADASLEALETFHRIDPEVDLQQRVETDRDFARVRDLPQFRQGLAAVLRPAPPQVPTAR
jgi:tetratricopeptide (TPR) repeat protein